MEHRKIIWQVEFHVLTTTIYVSDTTRLPGYASLQNIQISRKLV